jgi:hypothetical protein
VSAEDDKRSKAIMHQQNNRKCWKNSKTHQRRPIHELADMIGISYGVCHEILTENLNMRDTVPSSWQLTHNTWKKQFVTNNNMVIVPHPPDSPDLAPCNFTLFPPPQKKLKGWRFETVSDIQRESQAVLDSIKENDLHGASEAWKKQRDCYIHSQGDHFKGDGSQNWVS